MHKGNKILRSFLWVIGIIAFILALFIIYLLRVSKVRPPVVEGNYTELKLQRAQLDSGFYVIRNNWFRKNKAGLYEMYIEGQPFERGIINGKLSEELVKEQESYFTAQIHKMIPSPLYLRFLRYFIGWVNKELPRYVDSEYQQEIYGVSFSASDEFRYIGSNYQRILNYHSAHDIGHALQNMKLVGCTSFGTWGSASEDSTLIIGRNFDFWVGDDFAKNKIIAFVNPSEGYKFASITWAGFVGVVSGMNEKGLTVTINAAKSKIPSGAATPVSLVAREIIQYAKNISEAVAIARSRKMFVSESFLVGSAADNKAVIIEKTPDSIAVYDPNQNEIFCTNHFQSNEFRNSELNVKQIENSASAYRYQRLTQLVRQNGKNSVQKTVNVLRDYKGLDDADIGLGNEKAINQFIAHHAVVFQPQELKMWVSTSPWQLGEFVCYDLKKVFALQGLKENREICDTALTIPADSFITTETFRRYASIRNKESKLLEEGSLAPDSIIAINPNFYNSYIIVGDYWFKRKEYAKALPYYQQALQKEIATVEERKRIEELIAECQQP